MRSPIVFIATVTLLGCGDSVSPPGDDDGNDEQPPTVASVAVTPSTATLVSLGETAQLTASAQDASGNAISGKTFTWSSSDASIATVSATGLVTAVARNGSATITATADAVNGTAAIVVDQSVASVVVTPSTATLVSLGETVQLTASARDARGNSISGQGFTWSSSEPSVATVTPTGLATAVRSGPATISARADGVSDSSLLTVALTVHQTVATGVDGMVQFADANLEVEVVNVVTGEPIGGIEVTLIEDGAVMGLLMFDPDGEFAPVIRMTEQQSGSAARSSSAGAGASTIPISLVVRLIPRAFQDEVAAFTVDFNRTLRYARDLWFECSETTLGNAFTIVDAVLQVAYGRLSSYAVTAVTTTIASGGTLTAVGAVATVGSLSAIAFNLAIVDVYRALGYNDSDRFEVCQLHNFLIGLFLDGLILMAPVEDLPPPTGTASVSGTVRNAVTSEAIPGEVQLIGPSPRSLSTSDGSFEFTSLIPGSYVLSAASPGFLPSSVSISVSGGEAATQDIALSPRLVSGTLRIVLSWGVDPRDLDSHLWTPEIEGSAYHVYYASQGSLTSAPFAELDVDDVSSFGPETITIGQSFPGTYTYAVHNYTNRVSTSSDALSRSGASVEVFSADELVGRFEVANALNPGIGTWWHLFTLNGATQDLVVVNQLSNSAPTAAAAAPTVEPPKMGQR